MTKARSPSERRVIAELEEKLPEVETVLENGLGQRIAVLVDFASFPPGLEALECLESRGFRSVPDGLLQVASDPAKRQKILDQIEAIRLVYEGANCSVDRAVIVENKTLTIAFHWDGDLYIDGDLIASELKRRL
ncbi:MAG: hypothetical protein OHK005_02960 [Candidatus Methylacidiphilales bacterium]